MAPQNERIFTTDDTLAALREKAKEADEFFIKVNRRSHMGAAAQLIASFSGGRMEHFVSPELWVPPLCGGGKYMLQGYHSSDTNKAVGGFVSFGVDNPEPCDVNPDIVKKPDWRGPPVLEFPPRPTQRAAVETFGFDVRSPPAPGFGDQRHQNNHAGLPRQAGGGSVSVAPYGDDYSPSYDRDQRKQAALEAERRRLEQEKLELKDQRHREDLAAQQKIHEADMRALRAEISAQLGAAARPDAGSTAMAEMMKMQVETARLAAAQAAEDRRAAEVRAAEDRRDALARQERNDDRFNKLLEKITDRPKEDPLAVIEKVSALLGKNNSSEAHQKMLHSMQEMHSMQIQTAMDFIQASSDLQLGGAGEKKSPSVEGIEAGLKGLGSMMRGAASQKRQPQQFAQPAVPQTFEQQARQVPAGQQPKQPQGPQQAGESRATPTPTVLEQIRFGILGMAPVQQVAAAMIQHFKDPSIQAAISEANMDFERALATLMGNWPAEKPEHAQYMQALHVELESQLTAAGFFGPIADEPEGEGEEGGEEGGEGDEETE
jgi:hypothetical protein